MVRLIAKQIRTIVDFGHQDSQRHYILYCRAKKSKIIFYKISDKLSQRVSCSFRSFHLAYKPRIKSVLRAQGYRLCYKQFHFQ